MRLLTIGAKSTINLALDAHPDVDLWTLPIDAQDALPAERRLPYSRRSKIDVRSIAQVRDAVQRIRPDVVHAFYPRPLAHAVLAATSLGRRAAPIVSYRGVTSSLRRYSPDQWITYLSPRVAAHACESAAVADSLKSAGVAADACHVVHNCLGAAPELLSRSDARRTLGLQEDAFVVMMVANMRAVKGADLLLRAAIESKHLAGLKVVLVGRVLDPEVEQLADDERLQNIVHLAGYQTQASRLLPAADLFVMPSRAEALSVALLEAMNSGRCPVVSDAGGMKEAVRNGVDGVVFPSGDHLALASELQKLHADREQVAAFGSSAQQRVITHFSGEAVADRLVMMYRSVVGNSNGSKSIELNAA